SPDSLSLAWTVPQGHFDSFTVQYKDRDGRPQVVRVGGEESEVTVGGLEPGRKYKMHLYGLHEGQRLGPVSAVGVTAAPTTTPEPPIKPRLGELTVTDATPDSLSLSWTVPEGQFDHFLVQYRNGDGQPKAVRVPGHEDGVTISGLEPDHKYKMNLYGFHGGQRVGPMSVIGVTAAEEETPSPTEPSTEAPEPPEEPLLGELTVTGSSPDSLSLSWTVPQGHFDSFTVQYKDRDGRPQVVRVGGEESEVTVGGLEPGRKYKMHLYGLHEGRRVGPVSAVGVTEDEAEATQAVPTATPEPPIKPRLGELTVTDATPDSLSLSWTVPEGQFDHFLVQYRNGDGQPKAVRYKMNLYGFHGGQRVGPMSVIGVTAAEEETPTPTEPSTEAPEPPEEPLLGELTVTGSSPDSLSLSWTVPQGRFDSFTVQYKDRDGRPQVVRVGGEESEVTVGGLEPGRKYKMHLYGLHEGRRVGPVSAVGVTGDPVNKRWRGDPSAGRPRVQRPSGAVLRREAVLEGQGEVAWVLGGGGEVGAEGPRDLTVPIPVCPAPEDEAEATQAVPTATPEPPIKPRLGELTVTDATPDSLSLSWTVPEGQFDHFLVQYRNGDGQPKAVRVPGHEDGVTISGLEPDHKYKMNLYGFHGGQRVGPMSVIGVTEEETPSPTEPSTEAPEPPEEPLLGELTVTGSSPDSLSLSWTVPQGRFDSFTVQYKDRDGRPQVVRVGGEESEVTVGGLEPGRKYKMHLYGLHEGRRVGPVSTVGVTGELGDRPSSPGLEASRGQSVRPLVAPHPIIYWVRENPGPELSSPSDTHPSPYFPCTPGDTCFLVWLLFYPYSWPSHPPVPGTAPDTKLSPRLGELTVTDATPDSVGLSWTVPEGEFDSFVVQYKDKDGRLQVVPVAADQREVTVPGLEPSRKYKFLLYGLAGRKRMGPISADSTTASLEKEPPPRLGELTVTEETSSSLHLSWTVAQGPFESFVVQYRDTDGQPRAVPVAADQHTVTIEDLEPGKKYKFLLYGLVGGKRLGPISALGMTAPEEDTPAPELAPEAPEPPEEPRLGVLAVTDTAPDSMRLSWSVAQGPFDSFVVQYEDTNGQPQALLVDGDQSKILISGLEPSTPYRFLLYGLHEGKRLGPLSAEGTTALAPVGPPWSRTPLLPSLSVADVHTPAPPGASDSFLLRFGVPSQGTLGAHPRSSPCFGPASGGAVQPDTVLGCRGTHKADSIQVRDSTRTLSQVGSFARDLASVKSGRLSQGQPGMPPPSRADSLKVSYQAWRTGGWWPLACRWTGRARTQELQGLIPRAPRLEVDLWSPESEPLQGFLTTVPDGPNQLRALNLTRGSAEASWEDLLTLAGGWRGGSAVDYPLHDLVLHTNYTATVRGLRGPNLTPSQDGPHPIPLPLLPLGLEAPRDLEAKEVTPRHSYLLSFDTLGGRTQILLPGGSPSHQLLGLFPSTPYNARLQAMWGESLLPPVSTSFTTGGLRIPFPRDCGEEMQNGAGASRTTTIFLNGNRERPLNVFCDMETDGGAVAPGARGTGRTMPMGLGNYGWDGGNEALHSLTQAGDEAVFAQYDSFRVDSAAEYYRLHLEGYHGTAGDSMSYHSGSVFSARDRDPNNLLISCAVSYRGAWWYRNCHYANLNGLYGSTVDHQGVSWYHWKGFEFSVPFTEMKLRPRNFRSPAGGG
uniref:Tenascin XB n=1 Tax=Cercocebus atys TaxID=9531 RepID=A0A2K5LSB6_CERAT